ncbi:hypothetical protein MCP_2731 [Methanocella paludicola SANAE]|uniref:DUF2178 domain-containing protein n=1 Tax=Methanocella paludicola (strain DSM 17711 / JCM 13418 / NBRC 101707 / SANAE) TaxID=304371 RepID=D1Z281_METPS|nr:DUF2178 domain-containing protein [Methanocella paludicola]BAI62803.1 hypothetical protein MCP_2731 [Methanocella paludicola SANAE]
MIKTEESRIAVVILATFALLLVTGIFPQYVLWMTVGLIGLIVGLAIYAYLTKRKSTEVQDERSARCSLAASRNGFIVAIALIALIGAAVSIGAPFTVIGATQVVWGLSMAAYLLSYLYYKKWA